MGVHTPPSPRSPGRGAAALPGSRRAVSLLERSPARGKYSQVMRPLHSLMEQEVNVLSTKERYALGNNSSSKVLAFAFSLSAEIERGMISSRPKETLARKKRGQAVGQTQGETLPGHQTHRQRGAHPGISRQEDPLECHRPPVKRAPAHRAKSYSDPHASAAFRLEQPLGKERCSATHRSVRL